MEGRMGQQMIVKVSIIALVLGLILGFAGGYAYKNLNAEGIGGTGGGFGAVIVGSNFGGDGQDAKTVAYDGTKVVTSKGNLYDCPKNTTFKAVYPMPFARDQLTTALDYAGTPVVNGKKHHPVDNANYPGKQVLGYDLYYQVRVSSDGLSISAELLNKIEKVRAEPLKMYQANVGRFRKGGDTIYLGKDIVGPLDNGNNVKLADAVFCYQKNIFQPHFWRYPQFGSNKA